VSPDLSYLMDQQGVFTWFPTNRTEEAIKLGWKEVSHFGKRMRDGVAMKCFCWVECGKKMELPG
jgi:hypothetical protein